MFFYYAFSEYEFNIEIDVKYKLKSIFKITDWKYYNWLDNYIERLEHYCNVDTFYKDINWEHNKTIIQILNTKSCEQQGVLKMTGVICARYPGENQREESIEGQLCECKEFAQKNDIQIVGSWLLRSRIKTNCV